MTLPTQRTVNIVHTKKGGLARGLLGIHVLLPTHNHVTISTYTYVTWRYILILVRDCKVTEQLIFEVRGSGGGKIPALDKTVHCH